MRWLFEPFRPSVRVEGTHLICGLARLPRVPCVFVYSCVPFLKKQGFEKHRFSSTGEFKFMIYHENSVDSGLMIPRSFRRSQEFVSWDVFHTPAQANETEKVYIHGRSWSDLRKYRIIRVLDRSSCSRIWN